MTSLGEATVDIRATLDKLDGDLANARSRVQQAMASVTRIATVAAAGIGAAIGGAAAGAVALAANAEPLQGLEQGFASVMDRIGGSADEMLASLQDASGGLIANRDLMMSFNKAASLVSDDFASRLPDAMSLVQRAAAATGQDMGFLFDSLVTGVGRVSPMILDNLGIQVSLAEVTELAAEMFGKSADELTKVEQQAALTEIVMAKLNDAYGNVPDIETPFARVKVALANLRDEIGSRLLGVLGPLAGRLMDVAEGALPALFGILDNSIMPVVQQVADVIGTFFDTLGGGGPLLDGFGAALTEAFGAEVAGRVLGIVESLQSFGEKVAEFLQPVMAFIQENVKLSDVLIAVGGVILAIVVPAIVSAVAPFAALIGIVAAVTAVVAALRTAWERDFLGIRTALTQFWENTAKPALSALWQWLQVNVPAAIQAVTQWFQGTFLPAVRNVWSFIQTNLIPLFEALGELVGTVVSLAVQVLAGIWTNVLVPAMTAVWTWISTKLQPVFKVISDFISTHVAPKFQEMSASIGGVTGAIQTVIGWLRNLKVMLDNIQLPDWLQRHSPSEFEMTFLGASEAIRELSRTRLPGLQASLDATMLGGFRADAAGTGGGTSNRPIHVYLDGRLVGRGVAEGVQESFAQRGIRLEVA